MTSLVFKLLLAVVIFFTLTFVSGVTGFLFAIWPTSIGDKALNITPSTLSVLRNLQSERKFVEDLPNHYPGAPDEVIRTVAQSAVDSLLEDLIRELPSKPQRSFVLKRIKATLSTFELTDSEERDQLLSYCERILATVGIESSSELFNVWRYGFPYGLLNRA